jgi:hypothetical protein
MVPSFLFLRRVVFAIAGLEEAKNLAGESPPPDSDRLLATPSFEKISPVCQDNPPQAQIADSSSRNAVNFDYKGAAPTPQGYTQQGAGVVDFIAALRP